MFKPLYDKLDDLTVDLNHLAGQITTEILGRRSYYNEPEFKGVDIDFDYIYSLIAGTLNGNTDASLTLVELLYPNAFVKMEHRKPIYGDRYCMSAFEIKQYPWYIWDDAKTFSVALLKALIMSIILIEKSTIPPVMPILKVENGGFGVD